MQETWVQFLGWEDPLEKEMAIDSSILAWKIPWTEEPGMLKFQGNLVSLNVKVPQWRLTFCDPMDYTWNSPGQNTGVGNLSLLQGIFPTQRLNRGLPHCRWILYRLSHKESPRTLEWVAYPFFSGFFQRRNRTQVSHIAGGFFTS